MIVIKRELKVYRLTIPGIKKGTGTCVTCVADTLNLFDESFQGRTALSLFTVNALSQLPSVDMNWTNR